MLPDAGDPDTSRDNQALADAAIALARHRIAHGENPATAAQFAVDDLTGIPEVRDGFSLSPNPVDESGDVQFDEDYLFFEEDDGGDEVNVFFNEDNEALEKPATSSKIHSETATRAIELARVLNLDPDPDRSKQGAAFGSLRRSEDLIAASFAKPQRNADATETKPLRILKGTTFFGGVNRAGLPEAPTLERMEL